MGTGCSDSSFRQVGDIFLQCIQDLGGFLKWMIDGPKTMGFNAKMVEFGWLECTPHLRKPSFLAMKPTKSMKITIIHSNHENHYYYMTITIMNQYEHVLTMMKPPFRAISMALSHVAMARPSPVAPRQQQPEPGAAGLGGVQLPWWQGEGKPFMDGIWLVSGVSNL